MESRYSVVITREAEKILKKLDPAVFQIIQNATRKLKDSPELGKPLTGRLKGLFSWKVSRYRIVYSVPKEEKKIVIVGAGLRKEGDKRDIYQILHRLKEKGLLDDLLHYLSR